MPVTKEEGRERRKRRIRKKISGETTRPRISVFRSSKHIYVQAIDDFKGATLATASTLSEGVKGVEGTKTDEATAVGKAIAKALLEKGISEVIFDRNGYLYHGRVKALAEGAREGGLKF
jgi:large subunit ribosomal protein L18